MIDLGNKIFTKYKIFKDKIYKYTMNITISCNIFTYHYIPAVEVGGSSTLKS